MKYIYFYALCSGCFFVFSSCQTPVAPVQPTQFWQSVGQLPVITTSSTTYIPPGSVASMAVSSQGEIYAGTENGCVYCSANGGSGWVATVLTPDNTGNSGVDAMAVTAGGIAFAGIASSSQLYSGLFASTDGGRTWSQTSLGSFSVNAIAVDDNNGYIYAGAGYQSGIFRSSDYGVSWYPMDVGLTDPGSVHPNVWSLAIDARGDVYAGTASGEVFVSTNFGLSWNRTFLVATSGITAITIGNNQFVYAGSEGDSLYGSTDGGTSWALVGAGIGAAANSSELWSLATGLHGGIFMGILSGGIFESTDDGIDWNNISSGIIDGMTALATSASGYVFAGGANDYIYVSAQPQ